MTQHKALASTVDTPPAITIDPEFASLIPPLTDHERKDLEASLKRDGCLDPLVVWEKKNILLDGHHRFAICERLKIKYTTTALNFTTREAASDWMDQHQLSRRNLTPDQMSLLRGRRYNRLKKTERGRAGRKFGADKMSTPKTAEALAKQHGVTERTIRRDGKYAKAVAKVKPVVPDIETQAMTGKVSKRAVVEAARDPKRAPEILAKKIAAPLKPKAIVTSTVNRSGDQVGELVSRYLTLMTELRHNLRALGDTRVDARKWPSGFTLRTVIGDLQFLIADVERRKKNVEA